MEYTSPVLRSYFHFRRGKNMPTIVFSFIDYDDVVIGRVRPTQLYKLKKVEDICLGNQHTMEKQIKYGALDGGPQCRMPNLK